MWWQEDDSVWYSAEEDDNEETGQEKVSGDKPVYHGAPITVTESAVLILSFVMRHKLNGECLSDLLTLISLHCLTSNVFLNSVYKFKSFFSVLKSPLLIHRFCCSCEFLIKSDQNFCPVCSSNILDKKNTSYFVEIPLQSQLEQFFKRAHFHKNLMHRFSRTTSSNIQDIYDGELYKSFCSDGGFLCEKNNISLMWYTDGVPLFKSSKISIWPLFLAINELPFKERFKQENLLFAGLWFGKSKPSMPAFLKPFHESLKLFFEKGFNILCSHCSKLMNVKGILLCGTCDLPAKCLVLNMNQFNGKHGCAKCLQEGLMVQTGKGFTRTFPFCDQHVDGPKRSHKQFVSHGDRALVLKNPCFGVKGPSWLSTCCPDIINGTAIDYMHCVLLGIVRKLLVLWFEPKYSAKSFSISRYVSVADSRLSSIRPPYFIKRHPRDIKEHSKYWKASECRAWLFYYSVPVLFGLMKEQFFEHYLLLVEAIYILNLESISSSDLDHADELLVKFCGMFALLYGNEHMSANLHQLLHLTSTVKQLGPLWVYSCFAFESLNGKLAHFFHGTQNPVVQIANAVSTMLKIPAMSDSLVEGSVVDSFYKKLMSPSNHFQITECMFPSAYVVGNMKLFELDAYSCHIISQSVDFAVGKCFVFQRILLCGILYHSEKYITHCRNSCTVSYTDQAGKKYGKVLFYVKVYPLCFCTAGCICKANYVAVVQTMVPDCQNPFVSKGNSRVNAKLEHIFFGELLTVKSAIPIHKISGLGVSIDLPSNKVCVILPPNTLEND